MESHLAGGGCFHAPIVPIVRASSFRFHPCFTSLYKILVPETGTLETDISPNLREGRIFVARENNVSGTQFGDWSTHLV